MVKREKLYEGKAKIIYATDEPDNLWLTYKDSVTAFNGKQKDEMAGKGRLINEISALLFEMLRAAEEHHINTHFVRRISETEQLVKKVDIIPLEVVARNIAAGSISRRLGIPEGQPLATPIVEFYYKCDELDDPLVNFDHVLILKAATHDQLLEMKTIALAVNSVLQKIFQEINVTLVDFKLEFGVDNYGKLLVADEISPDTCRLWDMSTNEKLDKDVYRRQLGDMLVGYEEILRRLQGRLKEDVLRRLQDK